MSSSSLTAVVTPRATVVFLQTICYLGVLFLLAVIVYRAFLHPLAKIPGPFFASITRAWQTRKYVSGQWHDVAIGLHAKYGPVVRIAPDEVSFVDPDTLKKLYSYAKAAPKTKWYDTWAIPGKQRSFFAETNNKEHARRRRQVATAYSMTAVLSAESLIQQVADICWDQFRRMAATHARLNLDFWMTGFAYDVVGELGFGEPFGFMESGKDQDGIMESVLAGFIKMGSMGYVPGQMMWYNNIISKTLSKLSGKDTVNAYGKFVTSIDQRILARRARGNAARRDMLQYFFESKTDKGEPLPHGDILSECRNVIGAGADTTSIGIKAILGYLVQNPETLAKLGEEIDAYYEQHNFPDHKITYNQCLEMPLLQAIIKESTRLHPSIMFQLPRYIPPEGVTIGGYFMPGGCAVSMSPRSHNRSKEVFGDDADVWRPERWLENEEKARYMDSFLTTFGYGSRTCVGKNIALVEMNKFIAQFFRQFDLQVKNPGRPFKLYTLWFSIQQDFWVTVSERRPVVEKT